MTVLLADQGSQMSGSVLFTYPSFLKKLEKSRKENYIANLDSANHQRHILLCRKLRRYTDKTSSPFHFEKKNVFFSKRFAMASETTRWAQIV